jgi:hypothetical protein
LTEELILKRIARTAYGNRTCFENYSFQASGDNIAQILSYADFTSPGSIDAQMICSKQIPKGPYCADAPVGAFDPSLCKYSAHRTYPALPLNFNIDCDFFERQITTRHSQVQELFLLLV